MTKNEAMQMALDALELLNGAETIEGIFVYTDQETKALRAALAQPEKEWVGLTDEERQQFIEWDYTGIEAPPLRKKNT